MRKFESAGRSVLMKAFNVLLLGGVAATAILAWATPAKAARTITFGTVTCTTTTDSTYPSSLPNELYYAGGGSAPVFMVVAVGAVVNGNGLAISKVGGLAVTVTNDGAIQIDAGKAPTQGCTSAFNITAAGGLITYSGASSVYHQGTGAADLEATKSGTGKITLTPPAYQENL